MTETDIAWAAGFFDGEGCILPNYNRKGKTILRVTVGQIYLPPLEHLKLLFGGYLETQPRKTPLQTYYRWVVEYRKAKAFLEAVKPYLRVKQRHPYFSLSAITVKTVS